MMRLSTKPIRTLLVLCLLAPLTTMAQDLIYDEGKILKISNSMINLSDVAYKISPVVKVRLLKNKPGQISDLKVGNYAIVSITQIGKKQFVDTIQVVETLRSNETPEEGVN